MPPKLKAIENVEHLYRHRFTDDDRERKLQVWKVLCQDFFSKYVRPSDAVLDLGAGYCEFINNIDAARRVAVDANPELKRLAGPGVEAHVGPAEELSFLASESFDVVFSSNFFEHLPSKEVLANVVDEARRVLVPGGRLLAMGPNVKALPGSYWDYFDHHIPLTEKSVAELLELHGFEVKESLPRFLPYTLKSRLPSWDWLVRLYIKLGKASYPVFGRQFFVIGVKR